MRLRIGWLVPIVALLVPACNDDETNPFAQFSFSRAPSDDAVLVYASGAWAEAPGLPRELFAVNADGSEVERLTTCAERENPCDFLELAPSSRRDRIAAVRGSVAGDPAASALYFIDLARSVETILAAARRVQAADWSFDDSFILYSNGDVEDLFTVPADGQEQVGDPLTMTPDRRERFPRASFQIDNAVWEGFEETPGKSRIFSLRGGVDGEPLAVTEGGPGTEVLEGTPYVVGSDSTPAFSTNPAFIAFRRLTGTGNAGLGTWDIMTLDLSGDDEPVVAVGGGDVYRGAPDWSLDGRIAFVETDMAAGESRLVVVEADGSGRQVLRVEDAGFGMRSPRWLR